MTNILVIKSSLNGQSSQSNQLTDTLLDKWQAQQPVSVRTRDLASQPLPHLTVDEMQSWSVATEQRSPEQRALASLSDNLIREVQQADVIVIAMPMYNFGVPSVFKAWIDRIARAGVTFSYTANGPVGLLANKKVIINATRGGMYAGTEKDSQSRFLQDVLGFIGLTEVEFVYTEGLAMGEKSAKTGILAAHEKFIELIGKHAA